jgi:hypothetical protein
LQADWVGATPVAAVVATGPARISSSSPEAIRLSRSDDYLIELKDLEGNALDRVKLVRDRRESFASAADFPHPGIVYQSQIVAEGSGSPIWIDANIIAGSRELFWGWAPGRSYRAVVLESRATGTHRHLILDLGEGGDLDVQVEGGDHRSFALNVVNDASVHFRTDVLYRPHFELNGLPPGGISVHLSKVDDPNRRASASVEAVIGDTRASVVLLPDTSEVARGHLSGDLLLPESLDPGILEHNSLRLVVTRVRGEDGGPTAHTVPLRVELAEMLELPGRQPHYGWEIGSVDAGGYRIELEPLGFVREAWVEHAGGTLVELHVPDVERTRITFVDASTLEPQDVLVRSAVGVRATNEAPALTRLLTSEESLHGTVEVYSTPGEAVLVVESPVYGRVTHRWSVGDDSNAITVPVRAASWIVIEFAREDGAPCPWYGNVEAWQGTTQVTVLSEENRVTPDGDRELKLCIAGREPVSLRFYPAEGSDEVRDIDVPAGLPDPSDARITAPRTARVILR